MNQVFAHFDRVFMVVTPCKSLFRSSMVHDVVTKGRKFVVDMNSGELTIWNPQTAQTEDSPMMTSIPKSRTPSQRHLSPVGYVRSNGAVRYLSTDYNVARSQIEDEFSDGNTKGRLVFFGRNDLKKTLCISQGVLDRFLVRVQAKYSELYPK